MNPREYTAAMLARAIGVEPQAVRQRLQGVPASGSKTVAGNPARCYRLDDLPADLVEELVIGYREASRIAGVNPWRSLSDFIMDPPPRQQPTRRADPEVRAPSKSWLDTALESLGLAVSRLGKAGRPTPGESAQLWHLAFTALEDTVGTRKPGARNSKRSIRRWIERHVPFLGCTARAFDRKLARWRASGKTAAALVDGRPSANAKRNSLATMPADDLARLESCAIKCHGGRVAPAFRELLALAEDRGGFTEATRVRFPECPRRVRSLVVSRARELFDFYHQPRKASFNAAYSDRDWSEVNAGDWFSSDDFTLEVYFYIPDGKGWWTLTRGQFLPMIDERSLCILDCLLIPEGHYTGANIRTLINHVGLRFGLPRVGFHFESGIWKKSQLVSGAVPWGDVQTRLASRLGIRFQHSNPGNAKAKVIEFVGGILQRRLMRYPGWAGANEQVYKVERTQEAIRAVRSGRVKPWDAGFLSLDEWCARLSSECVGYNQTPMDSHIIGGNRNVEMAPEEAWRTFQREDSPLVNLKGSGAEHLLSHHWRELRITKRGIRFKHAGERFAFASADTGRHVGKTVKVFFDSGSSDVAHVELATGELFHVPRQPLIPAHGASKEAFSDVAETVGAHNRELRAQVSNLPHDFMPETRRNLPDPALARRQAAISTAESERKAEQRKASRKAERVNELARDVGARPPTLDAPSDDRLAEAYKMRAGALEALNDDEHE